jgi:hypothetical protein
LGIERVLHPKCAILIKSGNALLGRHELRKSRIACLADLSFHEGNVSLEAVSADAETDKAGADKAGTNANVESKMRRSIPGRRIVFFMLGYS